MRSRVYEARFSLPTATTGTRRRFAFTKRTAPRRPGYVARRFVSRGDPGLVILPTHRLATNVHAGPRRHADARRGRRLSRSSTAFRASRPRSWFFARTVRGSSRTAGAKLDTTVVDELPLEGVTYTASASEAERAVGSGAAAAAFLVRPPTMEQVESYARAGERMPPKSTYFFPKLTCGLLFSPFDE